jgi:hypothetical protein
MPDALLVLEVAAAQAGQRPSAGEAVSQTFVSLRQGRRGTGTPSRLRPGGAVRS